MSNQALNNRKIVSTESRYASVSRRRGAAAIIAMGCLVVAAIVILVLIKGLASQRLLLEGERDANQAALLADSGIEMAKAKLNIDSSYRGEVWKISAEQLHSKYSGEVVIEIDDSGRILVAAVYPYREPGTSMSHACARCERSVQTDLKGMEKADLSEKGDAPVDEDAASEESSSAGTTEES